MPRRQVREARMVKLEPDRGDAAAFIRDAPMDVHVALLRCLSPKWILRMRSVCKAWRDVVRQTGVLLALHFSQPRQQLLCFDRVACPDHYVQLRDYCVESLDLRSGDKQKRRAVFRFTDNERSFRDEDAVGRDAPYITGYPSVPYGALDQRYAQVVPKPQLTVHGSLSGYILASFTNSWFVINPATRHWIALPDLSRYEVLGFYFYVDGCSGQYRVLCYNDVWNKHVPGYDHLQVGYYVLTVGSAELRHIGYPISSAAPAGDPRLHQRLRVGVQTASFAPPIQVRLEHCEQLYVHWPPQPQQGNQMLVFDTGKEEFSWKRPPPVIGQDTRMVEYPNGDIGMSIFSNPESLATVELWCLEDYENDGWVLKYRLQLDLNQMPALRPGDFWIPTFVSPQGDVLIQSSHCLWHCDSNGTLLRKFLFPDTCRVRAVKHLLRESLVLHRMFRAPKIDGATEPPFFNWLCGDPSW